MTKSISAFYVLLLTQTVSLIGSQMSGLAIGIQIFNDTGDVLPLALLKIAYAIPMFLAAGIAGVVADRWDRRWVLILSDVGQAVGTVLLLLTFASGEFQLWHLYGIAFIQAWFGMFQHPAFQASVTMLVPDEHRDRANAIQQITSPAAGIIAPAMAGILFAFIGVVGVILIDLFTFAIAILVVFLIHIPQPESSTGASPAGQSLWREVTAGFRVLWERRILFYLVAAIMSVNFFWNSYSALQTPYILTITGSEALLGIMLSIGSAGFFVGGLAMSVWQVQGNRMRVLLPAIAAIGLFMLTFGLMQSPLLMAFALFLFYMPHPIVNTLLTSILQLKTPPETQGRVFAAVTQMAVLLGPIALIISGLLADNVMEPAFSDHPGTGMRWMIVVSGILYTLVGLGLMSWSRMRKLESELPDIVPKAEEA